MKGKLKLSYVPTLCLAFTLAITVPLLASAGLTTEQWVARYNSLGIGYDSANAIAVDSSGNVYVTGWSEDSGTESGYDYATMKYDTDGNQLWVKRYSSPGSGWDQAYAIAVDASGNVYVTGESKSDYATIKYDTNGNQLWVARYNGPESSDDEAYAIAVDLLGNVYVTGWSRGSETSWDYATVKYDTNGNELWVARYNDPADGEERAEAIAIDSSGNVYVTGTNATVKYDTDGNQLWVSQHTANAIAVDPYGNVYVTGWSYATVKYDTNGTEFWVSRYNSPGDRYGSASAIAVDLTGNVYVTGHSPGIGTGDDYATVKYDTDGNQLWVARYNGPVDSEDSANAISVDALGNVYVTGESRGSRTHGDYATIKYDTNGDEIWVARYNGPESSDFEANAITVDASGNVYVTGSGYATVKYDTDGNQLWVQRYNGPANLSDVASAIAIDASGNVYVTGGSGGVWDRDYTTVKYDSNGNQLWVARYNEWGDDYARVIAVDTLGDVYVTGSSWGAGMWELWDDYATVKYDTDGNELWAARYDSPGGGNDTAEAMAVDALGNVYVTGSSWGSNETWEDYATVKYDTHGNQLWVARYNGPGDGSDSANSIAVDSLGNVYVTGASEYDRGANTYLDYATIKYDTNGNQLWVKRYNGPGNGEDSANAIAVDPSGNVYVTGGSKGDYATVKYDTDGNELWVKRYNGSGDGHDSASAIAVDAWGNVYVTGGSGGSGTERDYATIKYDTDGNQLWIQCYNGPANLSDGAGAIAIDASGNVYVTGGSLSSGIEDDYYPTDYATVKYDTNGNQLWVKRYNGPGNGEDSASAIAVDASGNVYVTGGSESSETGYDYATVKYAEGVKMDLPAGWSMISLPVTPEVATVTTLFPEAKVVYRYQKGTGYVQVAEEENLEVGVGYWILLDQPRPYITEGAEITEYTIPVSDGWYMIGGCSMPADKMVTSGKIDVIYGYTQGVGYQRLLASEPLEREKGYWILFSNTSEGAEFTASTSASE